LPTIAFALDRVIRTLARSPNAPVGPEPLHDGRITEWLTKRPFVAGRNDLVPCTAALTSARIASERLSIPFELNL